MRACCHRYGAAGFLVAWILNCPNRRDCGEFMELQERLSRSLLSSLLCTAVNCIEHSVNGIVSDARAERDTESGLDGGSSWLNIP